MSRSGRGGAARYEEAYRTCGDAEVLIQTTPAGMYPDTDGCPVDLERLPCLQGVVDVVYNPLTTRLVRQARARGIPAENGLFMLAAQAVQSAEIFTGERFGPEATERVYRELRFAKRSIVLTGMPGSGKSTVGALLAERLRRPLLDTDAEIVRSAGTSIAEIFATRGEAYFRDLESAAIRTLSAQGGAIVATGGGAVLRRENVDALKQNGVLVFLDRPPDALVPTADRPLADDAEKLRELYKERYPIYTAAADLCVPVRGTPEETAETLMEMLQ